MAANILTFVIALVLAAGTALAIHRLLRSSTTALLNEVVGLKAATTFYFRMLCLSLFLSAATGILGGSFDLKPDARFMEYVWKIAAVLSSAFTGMLIALLVFLSVVTILAAVLRRRDQR